MNDKKKFLEFIYQVIENRNSVISTNIPISEFTYIQFDRKQKENIDCVVDLFIRFNDVRLVIGTKQGSETHVSFLIYKIQNNKLIDKFSISLHDSRLSKFVHNKRIEIDNYHNNKTVNDIISFISQS